jgi:hypothetical protein
VIRQCVQTAKGRRILGQSGSLQALLRMLDAQHPLELQQCAVAILANVALSQQAAVALIELSAAAAASSLLANKSADPMLLVQAARLLVNLCYHDSTQTIPPAAFSRLVETVSNTDFALPVRQASAAALRNTSSTRYVCFVCVGCRVSRVCRVSCEVCECVLCRVHVMCRVVRTFCCVCTYLTMFSFLSYTLSSSLLNSLS